MLDDLILDKDRHMNTFSFALGPQPRVGGEIRLAHDGTTRTTVPSVIVRTTPPPLSAVTSRRFDDQDWWPGDPLPLTGLLRLAEYSSELCDDDPSHALRDYRHPDPTDHQITNPKAVQITNSNKTQFLLLEDMSMEIDDEAPINSEVSQNGR